MTQSPSGSMWPNEFFKYAQPRMTRDPQFPQDVFTRSVLCALLLSSCSETQPGTNPEPLTGRVVLTDPRGDGHATSIYPAYVRMLGADYRSPDIRQVLATVRDGFLNIEVHFAPETFDPDRTKISLYLDTDEDMGTGVQRRDIPSGTDHMITFGARAYYPTSMHFAYAPSNPRGLGRPAGPYQILADGLAISIPLERIGSVEPRIRFYVAADVAFDRESSTTIMDGVPGDTVPTDWVPIR